MIQWKKPSSNALESACGRYRINFYPDDAQGGKYAAIKMGAPSSVLGVFTATDKASKVEAVAEAKAACVSDAAAARRLPEAPGGPAQ